MPDDSSERRAESPIIIAPRLSVARLAALAVWRFGQNGGAGNRTGSRKTPRRDTARTRHGHGKEPAGRSRPFDSGRSGGKRMPAKRVIS